MSPRLRVFLIVAVVGVVAAGVVVGTTLATRQTPAAIHPFKGKPTVAKDLPTPAAARIRAAFRAWPHGSLDIMQTLGREYKRDPVVQLYLGVARSGTTPSIRDSRLPRGTWTAPGRWPCSHSS